MRRRGFFGGAAAAGAALFCGAVAGLASPATAQGGGFDERGGGFGYGRGTETSARSGSWEGRMRTDRSQYPRGRGVEITLLLTNTSTRRMEVASNVCSPEYVLTVRDARTNQAVWTYAKRRSGVIRVEPRDTRMSREFGDQRNNQGQRVPAGSYRVEAVLHPNLRMTTTIFLQDGRGEDDDRPGGGGGRPGRPGVPGDLNPPNWGGGRPGRPGDGGGWPPPAANPSVRAEVRADRARIRPGDRVGFNFSVRNASGNRQNFRFSSGRQYEVEVLDGRGRSVWAYTREMVFTQSFTDFSIDPNQSKNFFANWNVPRDLPRGTYQVVAYLPTLNGRVGESRTRITVE